jgi:CRISPR-associated protein Cas5d
MPSPTIRVRVSGDYACFTRPETKVERYSYPVMTPSAARNILDAICWRPQMRWVVTRIAVLKEIRTLAVLRNEVQSKLSPSSVKNWMADSSKFEPLLAGAGNGTDGTLIFDRSGDNTEQKYVAMMERRVARGQCFQRPYLGCREFAAEFSTQLPEDKPISKSMPIGRMLYDIAFLGESNRSVFFDAQLVEGVLHTDPSEALGSSKGREEVLQCSYRR